MTRRNFPCFDETNAAPAARPALEKNKRAFGAIPKPVSRYASSPLLLNTALSGLQAFEESSLAPLEREVLAMTMGHVHGCKFCLNLHQRLLSSLQAPAQLASELSAGGALTDGRLEALRRFVLATLEQHGDVSEVDWQAFRDAGFTHEQALDVVLGVGVYTITTLANRLTESSE